MSTPRRVSIRSVFTMHAARRRGQLSPLALGAGLIVSAAACGDSPVPPDDAGSDGGIDAAMEDVRPDIPVPDVAIEAQPDAGEVESGTDSDSADGSDADSDTAHPDAPPDSEVAPDTGPDAPYPPVCGDGWRDPATEECDDGLDDTGDVDQACGEGCAVRDRIASFSDVTERRLGLGRHPAAAGEHGAAVAFVEVAEPSTGSEVRLGVAAFSPVGERRGTAVLPGMLYDADPVVAALPDGGFAVAYTSLDADGDGLGVALTRVDDASFAADIDHANATTEFGQHSPDMVWAASQLVVGWVDESAIPRRLCTRRFSSSLQPVGGESVVGTGDVSNLVLAAFSGETVTSWREDALDQDDVPYARVHVSAVGGVWSSTGLGLPVADEKATIGSLDSAHLLVAYADDAGMVYGVVLDETMQSVWGPQPLTDEILSSHTPSVAVTSDGVYLAYRTSVAAPDPDAGWDPAYDDVWVRKLVWDGATLDLSQQAIALPHDSWTLDADQRRPVLVAAPYFPSGAVFAAWEDFGADNYAGQAPHGDVVVSLIPTPILRLAGGPQ